MGVMGGKRFIKKVPASGLAPAYKLTLPHQVVHKYLNHLVGMEFELASSADGPTWPGGITPRRNKDRSEYTLKGWKMFAEAHRVQLGDHVSFELTGETRLLAQVISARSPVLDRESPSRSPSAPSSPSKSPKRWKLDSPEGDDLSCTPLDPLSEEHMFDIFSPGSVFSNRWSDGQEFPDLPDSPTALSLNVLSDAMGLPPTPEKPFSDVATGQLSTSECSTQLPWQISQASLLGSSPQVSGVPIPSTPPAGAASSMCISHAHTASGAGSFKMSPPLHLDERARTPIPDHRRSLSAGPSRSCSQLDLELIGLDGTREQDMRMPLSAGPSRSCSHLDMQLMGLGSRVQSLHADMKGHESRANRAEQEEARLRFFLEDARAKLQRGLQAAAGLERVASRLGDPKLLAVGPRGDPTGDKLRATQDEMRACLDTLKDSLWQVLSTDI